MKCAQQGSTIVELAIAVLIAAVLVATALPIYENYAVKARVTEALGVAGACTTAVSDYLANHHALPATLDASGCEGLAATKYVGAIDVVDGVITLTMATSAELRGASGRSFVMSPTLSPLNSIATWTCAPTDMASYLPGVCRNI
jgi:type IV pilus assembly protein PilA